MGKALLNWRWRTFILALPFLFYCLFPTRNYYWDGLAFAIDIEKHPLSSALLYPSHLIYESFGGWLYRLSEIAGMHTRALYLMQGANCVLAGLSVFLLDKCLRLRNVPADIAVAWALVFGFSATWWRFASDANAYVPAIFLLLCAEILLESNRVTAAAVLTACAMLFHELAVLFLLVALIRLFPKTKTALLFLAIAVVPVALAYVIAYHAGPGGAPGNGFFAWVTWHSPDSSFSFRPLNDVIVSLRGTLRLFFGGRLAEFAGDAVSKVSVAVLAAAIAAFFVALWQAIRKRELRAIAPSRYLLAWIGVYVIFLLFWMPQNTFYRLFYLAPLVLLLATALHPGLRLVWTFAAVLALWNFTFLSYPQSRPEANAPLRFALARVQDWSPGTPIVFRTFHPDLWTISYFNQQASWIGLDHPDPNRLQQLLDQASAGGRSLWIEETAYLAAQADPAARNWMTLHELPKELIEFKDDRHDFRFHRFGSAQATGRESN
ncbi:MAG TPA: hypothetical protein VGL53_12425 [Bryobacteraceae bacterium]|jgi:hypothetical protein